MKSNEKFDGTQIVNVLGMSVFFDEIQNGKWLVLKGKKVALLDHGMIIVENGHNEDVWDII